MVSESASVEEFSISEISKAAESYKEHVTAALDELCEDEKLWSQTIQMDVYIPRGRDGQKILQKIAQSGFLTSSTYLPVLACLAALNFAIGYYPYTLSRTQNVTTLNGAYLLGIKNGVLYSGFFGVVGGGMLQLSLNKFKQWKILSVRIYERVVSVSKLSTVVFIVLMAGYSAVTWWTLHAIDPTMAVALLGNSATIAFGMKVYYPRSRSSARRKILILFWRIKKSGNESSSRPALLEILTHGLSLCGFMKLGRPQTAQYAPLRVATIHQFNILQHRRAKVPLYL